MAIRPRFCRFCSPLPSAPWPAASPEPDPTPRWSQPARRSRPAMPFLGQRCPNPQRPQLRPRALRSLLPPWRPLRRQQLQPPHPLRQRLPPHPWWLQLLFRPQWPTPRRPRRPQPARPAQPLRWLRWPRFCRRLPPVARSQPPARLRSGGVRPQSTGRPFARLPGVHRLPPVAAEAPVLPPHPHPLPPNRPPWHLPYRASPSA